MRSLIDISPRTKSDHPWLWTKGDLPWLWTKAFDNSL